MSSSKESREVSAGGISFASLLGLLFIGLKLTGVIHWGWLWVLSPFWIPWAFVVVVMIIIGVFALAKIR